MVATTIIFAAHDGISRYLAGSYDIITIKAIRYWFFALFVCALSAQKSGGFRQAAATTQPWLQTSRGKLLAAQICVGVLGFSQVGFVQIHAIFASDPLVVMALSVPFLGEIVSWWRWLAVDCGFAGVLVILQPGSSAFGGNAILPLCAAILMAVYGLSTRFSARRDNVITSFFWTGVAGAVAITSVVPFFGIRRRVQTGGRWLCYASPGPAGIFV